MKIKCPFCKQSYDLSDTDIVAFGTQEVECANCGKSFSLRETVSAYEQYRRILDLQKKIEEAKEILIAKKQNLKMVKEMMRENGIDEYDWIHEHGGMEQEMDVDDAASDIDDLKNELTEAKEEYKTAKGNGLKKGDAEEFLGFSMYELYEKGFLKSPLSFEDKGKILRYLSMGNCEDVFGEILRNRELHYCLIDEFAEIGEKLMTDKYLPLMGIPKEGDGTITPKQHALLLKFGLNGENLTQLSKQNASSLISFILNEDDIAREEWLEAFLECSNREELLEEIANFKSSDVIIPPPKDGID